MSTNSKNRLLPWIMLGLIATQHVYADKFYGSVSALTEETDNALQSTTDHINERQDQYGLSIGGEVVNSLIDFNAGYNATARTYETQETNTLLEGKSTLLIGKRTQPLDLLVEHSRITVLNKPDDKNVRENQDERDLISVTPTLRAKISSVDNIYIQGKSTKVNYVENENKNSQRNGGVLGFEHRISNTDNLQILTQQTDIEFKNSPTENYVYRSAEIIYSTKLRQLSYSAQVGANQSLPENNEDYVRPKYAFALAYNSGIQIFSLNVHQELTDASLGGGNRLTSDNQTIGNDSNHNLDRFERRSMMASWNTHALCTSCSFLVSAYFIEDHYIPLEQESTQQGWDVEIRYALSNNSTISTKFSTSENKFTEASFGEDFSTKTAQVEFEHQLNGGFSVGFHVRNEKRDSLFDNASYSERYIGAGINYDF